MVQKNLMPHQTQPINRSATGQLPPELAELSEEALTASSSIHSSSTPVLPSQLGRCVQLPTADDGACNICCSYDGDDGE